MCSNYRTDSPKTCSSILSSFSCKLRFLLSLLHVLIVYVKLIGNKRGKWKGKKEDDDDNEEEEQKQEREQEQKIDIVLFHYVKKKTQQHEQSKKKHKKGDDLYAAPTSFQFLLDTDKWLPAVNSPEVAVIHEILILVTHFV